ncbi:hypothetical protein ABIE27_002528 [Paenibacillus sp. 4624]
MFAKPSIPIHADEYERREEGRTYGTVDSAEIRL